jgi:hypothetical protein
MHTVLLGIYGGLAMHAGENLHGKEVKQGAIEERRCFNCHLQATYVR